MEKRGVIRKTGIRHQDQSTSRSNHNRKVTSHLLIHGMRIWAKVQASHWSLRVHKTPMLGFAYSFQHRRLIQRSKHTQFPMDNSDMLIYSIFCLALFSASVSAYIYFADVERSIRC